MTWYNAGRGAVGAVGAVAAVLTILGVPMSAGIIGLLLYIFGHLPQKPAGRPDLSSTLLLAFFVTFFLVATFCGLSRWIMGRRSPKFLFALGPLMTIFVAAGVVTRWTRG